jgi:DNA-binding NtrC family response regulator
MKNRDDDATLTITQPVLIGDSAASQLLRAALEQVARGDAKVLITGESGVGKDVAARYLHARSPRRDRPFVAVNCAALSEGLLESELFGHLRGSFTGAYRDKVGKLQLAHTGTIFLDEVGEMTLRMQALLLRFLESGEIQPVGCDQAPRRVAVRVIAATNRDLAQLIAAGQFREDLMYRLKVVHVHVPPLRDRRDDVRPLLQHAVERTRRAITFSDAALQALESYTWPGNIRELQNVVEQVAWMTSGPTIELEHLPAAVRRAKAVVEPTRERRRQIADELFDGLLSGRYAFWTHIHPLFLNRDITRHDLRQLVGKALAATIGNYRAVLKLFGMADDSYKRFMNFLAAHECAIDFRPFRSGQPHTADITWKSAVRRPPAALADADVFAARVPPAAASTNPADR